ncbi:HU family DNA-binding protein [Streptomyces sp. HNM0663]|uniref:HU family DNA-binding protein n=1 Tax=Streptomyces chengmaiensis TaxID=3040919 RepID=A0ABT6HTA8_9ACTN|nr:HU family DNA-binding protein [Streptomyces chengmaiensis]MDH2391585.1 HU family DNA-binding protein [Streptomyces chengmaiensis]
MTNPRVSKREFISRVATRSGSPVRVVSKVYESLLGELTGAVSCGETVVLTGFGRFYRQDHKGHKVRFGKSNVGDYVVLKFSASSSFNRRLGGDEDEIPPETCGVIEDTDQFENAIEDRALQAAS